MKRILGTILAVRIGLSPLTIPFMVEPSRGQIQNYQRQQVYQLLEQGKQQAQQEEPLKSIETFEKVIAISRQLKDRKLEASGMLGLGFNYDKIGQRPKALDYYNQALPIFKVVDDRVGEATTLNNMGASYDSIGQPQKALEYLKQALAISRKVYNRAGVVSTLNNIATVYRSLGQPQEGLKYLKQALPISREVGNPSDVATILNNIGLLYNILRQHQKALDYYNQALKISRKIDDRSNVAAALHNMGALYSDIKQPQKALDYFKKALPILRQVGDRTQEATTLNNIGVVYSDIKQPQKALDYYKQALPIRKEVRDRAGEATTLNNIGVIYRNTKRPTEAIEKLEEATKITLEMRGGLQRENRQNFLKAEAGIAVALVELLIKQNQSDRAYEWINRVTNAELADYTRLINAKVANPQAQKAIDDWNQKHQQLQFLQQQLQQNFSEQLSRQMRDLEAKVNKQAEDISRSFPEVAELFETKPADIEQLKKNIPSGTVIIHPVLLTDTKTVTTKIAIFVITKDKLTVTQISINSKQLNLLITYREQLENPNYTNYLETSEKLYDILIRPVEDKIPTAPHTQVSIIAPNELRYLPFETLYDSKNEEYLIQKYPINYLTFISTRSWQNGFSLIQGIAFIAIIGGLSFLVFRKFGIVAAGILVLVSGGVPLWLASGSKTSAPVLALGNPKPIEPYILKEAEAEVKEIEKIIPGSKYYIHKDATLDRFKTEAPRFPFLHLATHACFQLEGCKKLNMKANTILFADQQYNIADAALLGLQNTELLTLSACQTAKEAVSNGETISGVAYVFERAGAKAIIASLWNANDDATSKIMIQFYQNLNKGMSKSEALRQAKLGYMEMERIRSRSGAYPVPFFWSPLILIGDGR
jgi:CHAT domain-containing protein/tetratricopeptide (TPR) repeat protein